MTMKYRLLGALAAVAMFSATNANAQASQNLNVEASVPNVCVVNNAATDLLMNFGDADVANATDTDVSVNFVWRCTTGTPVAIQIDGGTTAGSDAVTGRLLAHDSISGETLRYLLCQDLACTTPWGDGTNGDELTRTGGGMASPVTERIYGTLFGASAVDAAPGVYTETVVVSLVF